MSASLLADCIVALHFTWVAAVVAVPPLVIVGWALDWAWVRKSWLRNLHLAMIGAIALEAWLGILCPLTVWENALRVASGGTPGSRTFIGRLLHELIYYDLPSWAFTLAYSLFFVLVAVLYVAVPPAWLAARRKRSSKPG